MRDAHHLVARGEIQHLTVVIAFLAILHGTSGLNLRC